MGMSECFGSWEKTNGAVGCVVLEVTGLLLGMVVY